MELRDLRKSNEWAGASEQLQKSVNALGSIAETEARVPGRKLLLWISPGWPLFAKTNTDYSPQQGRNIFSAIVNLANGLSQGDVVLYAVDPTGIADLGNREWETFLKPVRQSSSAQLADLGLQVLATQSGGRFVYGNNDLTEEITRCIRDGSAGYTLRFAPQRSQVSDTWHEIKVRVDKPGFIVRTRNGYYAEP
jgi:VWFA-related protein